MTDELHQTHLPAAWGEQLPLWTEPLRTPAGCAATVFVLCCFAPIFLFQSATCMMRPIREREAARLAQFEDLHLEMPVEEFLQLRSAPASPAWKSGAATFNGFDVDRFTLTYPSPYPGWETCELTFDQPATKWESWTVSPAAPLPEAHLISIQLDHHRQLTPEEVAREVESLERRYPSRHSPPSEVGMSWPAASNWDDFEDTKIRNRVWYWYKEDDSAHPDYLPGATLSIGLEQDYTSD